MKYKDRNTINSWNRQIDKFEQEDTDRKIRRKRDRDLNNFSKAICLVLDKDWWDCVNNEQKNTLLDSWESIRYYKRNMGTNDLNFGDWAKEIQPTVIIDKALYRDKRINNLLK